MDTQLGPVINNRLTDVVGLRTSGIFPKGKEPSIRTLRTWTKLRRIPFHRVGHFVYFDPNEVEVHIRTESPGALKDQRPAKRRIGRESSCRKCAHVPAGMVGLFRSKERGKVTA